MFETKTCPSVSIIMPTYNRAGYITESIKSIRGQTYDNWELLIIDDGSDDDTEDIVRQIKDARIQFHKETHQGIEKIRNKGLKKASGEFIAFIDSDDLWAPEKLQKQINAFHQYPEAGFCMAGGYNFRKPGEPISYFYTQKSGLKFGDLLIPFFNSQVAATTPTLIFRKNCLDHIGYFKETRLSHIHFMIGLARNFKGIILYEPLFFRRLHQCNYSSLNQEKRHYEGIKMIKHYKVILPRNVFKNSIFRSYLHFGEECLKNAQQSKAICQFLQAWTYKPLSVVPLKKIAKSVLHFF